MRARVFFRLLALLVIAIALLGFAAQILLHSSRHSETDAEIANLKKSVQIIAEHWNEHSPIRNSHIASPLESQYIPVVLYVFNRPDVLRVTVEALRKATGVSQTILIVSHDGLNPDVAKVVDEIDFMRVKQLIHPVPLRAHGSLYGLKNHWWWLMQRVFRHLPDIVREESHVLFIEEDHALSPDFYIVLKEMVRWKERRKCPDCWGVSLNQYLSDASRPYALGIEIGHSNTAYAFNTTIWRLIEARSREFHAHRDGWDWSLYMLMQRGWVPDKHIAPKLSRVRNVGRVGLTIDERLYEESGMGVVPVSEMFNVNHDLITME